MIHERPRSPSPFRTAALTALLSASLALGTAHATLRAVEQAYELHLSQVVLPAVVGGSLIVRACVACKPVTLVTSARTRFIVGAGGSPVTLADFTKALEVAKRRAKPMIYVYYKPETRHVNRVVLGMGPGP
jgi:hypothetical protein